jgi:hypothetical protein
MNNRQQLPVTELWNRLQPQYKLLTVSPGWVGIGVTVALLYPEASFIGSMLGIGAVESVNKNPNGSLFMLMFCCAFTLTLELAIGLTYLTVIAWLVKVSGYSLTVAKAAMSSRSYPLEWFKN